MPESALLYATQRRSGDTCNCSTGSLVSYAIPSASDLPSYETERTQTPSPLNPLGAKGIGEIGITGTAAAIANAVHNATGIRVRDLPITPDRLVR